MTLRKLSLAIACLASAAVVASGAGCASRPRQRAVEGGPVETGAGTTRSARNFLEGRWTLISFEVRPPGREPIQLKGTAFD